jgi:hypothetical protein
MTNKPKLAKDGGPIHAPAAEAQDAVSQIPAHLRIQHEHLPAGFSKRRKAGPSPYPDNALCELMVRTKEGLGSTGVTRPRFHDWDIAPDKVGGIVGTRLIDAQAGQPA